MLVTNENGPWYIHTNQGLNKTVSLSIDVYDSMVPRSPFFNSEQDWPKSAEDLMYVVVV